MAWRWARHPQGTLPQGHPLSWGWAGLRLWEEGRGGRWGGGAFPRSLLRLRSPCPSDPCWLAAGPPEDPPLDFSLSVISSQFPRAPSRDYFSPSLPAPPTAAVAESPSSAAPTSALSPAVVTGLTRKLPFRLPAPQAAGQGQAFRGDSGSGLTPELALPHLPRAWGCQGPGHRQVKSPPADRPAASA